MVQGPACCREHQWGALSTSLVGCEHLTSFHFREHLWTLYYKVNQPPESWNMDLKSCSSTIPNKMTIMEACSWLTMSISSIDLGELKPPKPRTSLKRWHRMSKIVSTFTVKIATVALTNFFSQISWPQDLWTYFGGSLADFHNLQSVIFH